MYQYGYGNAMNIVEISKECEQWLAELRDIQAKARILGRIKRAKLGNFGDYKNLGGGLYEMRIHSGPGYRLYYTQIKQCFYFILIGGSKSTQEHDIAQAREIMERPNE